MTLTLGLVRDKGMVPCKILDQYLSLYQTWMKCMTGFGNNEALKPLT